MNALIFDIETIADLTPENRPAIAKLAKGRDKTPEDYGGLCPPLARVVCIAAYELQTEKLFAFFDDTLTGGPFPDGVDVDGGNTTIPCAMVGCAGEATLLARFGAFLDVFLRGRDTRLVTYNGRGFDLPVLYHRSIALGVVPGRAAVERAARDPRYKPMLHIDLMDSVTFAGAAPRWPLAAYAIGYGYPSPKAELDGSQVGAAVQAGRIVEVVRYCASDVMATTHIYRRLQG